MNRFKTLVLPSYDPVLCFVNKHIRTDFPATIREGRATPAMLAMNLIVSVLSVDGLG